MILDLTIENLLESGLNIQDATALFNTTGNYNLQCNSGNFWVSKLENKFYTGIDFYRITYFNNGSLSFPIKCVDLVPEYFDLALNEFLEKQKTILGILYNETDQFNKFISNEIESSQISIENYKALIKKVGSWRLNNKENDIQIRESYINYLKGKQHHRPALNSDTAPTGTEIKTPIKVIALLHWYNNKSITRYNAGKIAKQYNYTAKTSGDGLYQDYLKYSNNTDRLASGGTKLKLKYKIQLFENVIKLLTDENAINRAQTDLKTLQSKKKTFD